MQVYAFISLLIFATVKRWLGYILSFYLFFNIVVPCSVFDKCEEAPATEQSSGKESKKDCNGCSPFCVCSSAHSFTNNKINPVPEAFVLYRLPAYSGYYPSFISEYYSSFFQPPRLG